MPIQVPRPRMFRRRNRIGAVPGLIEYGGEELPDRAVEVFKILYGPEICEETLSPVGDLELPEGEKEGVTWIHLNGIHNTEVVERIRTWRQVHPLVVEDIVQPGQRPQLEDYDDYLFVIAPLVRFKSGHVRTEQISILVWNDTVISFQETEQPIFEPLRTRIRRGKGRIRRRGTDYLLFAILDLLVDHQIQGLERLERDLEELDRSLMDDPTAADLRELHQLKWELMVVRRLAHPLRSAVKHLLELDSDLLQARIRPYFEEVYEHLLQVVETVDMYREAIASIIDLRLSLVGQRTGEVMQVLTIMASIFIPLSFIAGVYGMNIDNIPWIDRSWAFTAIASLMLTVTLALLLFFKRKGWFD